MGWYLAIVIGIPLILVIVAVALGAGRRRASRVSELESAYGARRDAHDETADVEAAERKALRDVDLYEGAKHMNLPRGG